MEPTKEGPGGTRTLVQSRDGVVHLRLTYRADLAQHATLMDSIRQAAPFLEHPRVPALAPLAEWDRASGTVVYPIGGGLLLADFLDERPQAGLRAALELLVAVGPALDRAHDAARTHGIPNHRALSPWRIVVQPTHEVTLIGYGIPAVEVSAWLDEVTNTPPGPVLRYFPPERIENRPEDVRADIYAVGVCAAELALGRPMLTGEPSRIVDCIVEGRIAQDLLAVPDADLPPDIKRLFVQIVAKEPENRFTNGTAMAKLAASLLPDVEGPTLFDVGWADDDVTELGAGREESPPNDAPSAAAQVRDPTLLARAFADDAPIDTIRRAGQSAVDELHEQLDGVEESPARGRAERALAAAQRALQILELDDDRTSARLSLDLLLSSVRQASRALDGLQSRRPEAVDDDRLDPNTLRQWADLQAQSAGEAAQQAETRVSELEREQRSGQLSAPGTLTWFERAVEAAESSHRAAEEARETATRMQEAATGLLAGMRETVHAAAKVAREQCETCLTSADEAQALERRTKREADKEAARLQAEGRLVMEEARRAVQRVEDPGPQSTEGLYGEGSAAEVLAGCRRAQSAAELTAARLERLIKDARLQRGAAGTRGLVDAATDALEELRREVTTVVAACDRAMPELDEASRAQARVGQLSEHAVAQVGWVGMRARAVRQELDSLLEETAVLADDAWAHRTDEAGALVTAAEEHLPTVEKLQRSLRVALNEESVRRKLPELEDLLVDAQARLEAAETRVAELREAADERLATFDRELRRRRAIERAAAEARQNAKACDALMVGANQLFDQRAAEFQEIPDPEVRRLIDEAMARVADAQTQADAADAAATAARDATTASEARDQAQITATCLEMISSILPDALEGLDQAEHAASLASQRLESARRLADDATQAFADLLRESQSQADPRIEQARAWLTVPDVEKAAKLVQTLLATLHAERADLGVSVDRLRSEPPDPWASTQAVDQAQATLERIPLHRRRVEHALNSLAHAVAESEAAAAALEQAREELQRTRAAIGADRARVDGAIETLERARDEYRADGDPVVLAARELAESRRTIERTHEAVASLVVEARNVSQTRADARSLTERAATLRADSEAAADRAMDAEAAGVLAAREEAERREAEEQRRLAAARDDIRSSEGRIAERISAIDEAIGQVRDLGCDTTLPAFREAIRLQSQLQLRRAMVEGLIVQAETLEDRMAIESLGQQARDAYDETDELVANARVALETAQDHARRAAAEAEALQQVRAELRTLVEQADAEVHRAREDAERFLQIIREAPLTEVRPLADAAAKHVQAASTAAARVRTASPLAMQAENLEAAQTILRRGRTEAQQAREAADAVHDLVEQGLERLRQEREAAARAVAEARHRVLEGLQQAQAAVKKARAWLESGREEAEAASAALDGSTPWTPFETAVGIVLEHGRFTEEAASPLDDASDVAEIETIGVKVASASRQTVEAAQEAKLALERLRSWIADERAAAELRRTQARHVAEQALGATQMADQAESHVRELELSASRLGLPIPREVRAAIDALRAEAVSVRFAAARAEQAAEQVKSAEADIDAATGAQEVSRAVQSAKMGLGRVSELEEQARTAITRAQEARRVDEQQREAEARRRAEAAARRAAEERRQRDASDRAARAERERRQEARRARLAQREQPRAEAEADVGALAKPLAGSESRRGGSGLYGGSSSDGSPGAEPVRASRTGTSPGAEPVRASRTGNIWPPADRRPPVSRVRKPSGPSGDDLVLGEADAAVDGDAQRSTAEKVDALLSRLRARRLGESS